MIALLEKLKTKNDIYCYETNVHVNNKVPFVRHYKPRFVYVLPNFGNPFFCFQGIFTENSVFKYG